MKNRTALTRLGALLLFSPIAIAQEPARTTKTAELLPSGDIMTRTLQEYSNVVNACGRVGPPESNAFLDCMQKAAAQADANLNEVYQDSTKIIVPYRRAELADAQRAWLKSYRLNCNFVKGPNSPKSDMYLYYDCIIKMAIERAKELRYRVGD